VRFSTAWDSDERVNNTVARPRILGEAGFLDGYKSLARFDLAFDAWVYHPQLSEVADLAAKFPDTPIVLNHFGSPILGGPYAGRTEEAFAEWRVAMTTLAAYKNVNVKLGALPVRRPGKKPQTGAPPLSSEEIASAWRPFFEVCVDQFGADRCMFESNFPVQKRWCSYAVLWNACKRLATGCSDAEKSALFSGTAARVYRVPTAIV
jgi:predicted TIM-barrel fold metal-dependent hydrolase